MSEPEFLVRKVIKTTQASDAALGRVVASLKPSPRLRFKGKRVTQEAVFSALLLWVDSLPLRTIEEGIAEFVPEVEATLAREWEARQPGSTGRGEPEEEMRAPPHVDIDPATNQPVRPVPRKHPGGRTGR